MHASMDCFFFFNREVLQEEPNSPGAAVVLRDSIVRVKCWQILEAEVVAVG